MDEEREQNAEKFEEYLHEIQRIPPMTQEEETQLAQHLVRSKAEQGKSVADQQLLEQGEQACRRLTEATLPVVVSIAETYAHREKALPLMNLINAGKVGLERATEGFDPMKGYDFRTYATWWIRQAMTRAMTS